jgi:O-antigen ligase
LITAAGIFSAGSAGACLAIFAGLATALVFSKKPSIRVGIIICLLLSAAVLPLSNRVFDSAISSDFALKENDYINLRQRYIEWQAELNLLEKRGITGTGAGCVNDYRSNSYYRLPKLNTLKSFDQNGFLAVAAETGLLGLAAFIWILVHYGRMSFRNCLYLQAEKTPHTSAMATANTAAFVSALTANLFSSVHYNGILIVFVLLLCLISSVNRIYGENTGEG